MKIYTLQLGIIGANCYIIETAPGRCVAVDIGGDAQEFLDFINQKGLKLSKILLTHGHYDHVGGVEEVRITAGAEVFVHTADAAKLKSADESLATLFNRRAFKTVSKYNCVENDCVIDDGDCKIKVMHTPGHTAGCVCYIIGTNMFTGDTLFCQSVGRTDFPDGDSAALMKSLSLIAGLEGDYKVFPGHEAATTLAFERKNNPYMKRYV